jgi:putative membrane protein
MIVVLVAALAYGLARLRLHARSIAWPVRRDLAFAGGLACLLVALSPPVAARDEQFTAHMLQHLLLGMAAPFAFALAAPVTLVLRSTGGRPRRMVAGLLRSPVLRAVSWAPVGMVLSVGLMWPLYLTGLYAATLRRPMLHELVHLHQLLAGCLLAFALIGADPMPGRGSRPVRLATMFAAFALHAILAKYLYLSDVTRQDGARLMWYGGEVVDLATAVVFFGRWYVQAGRRFTRSGPIRHAA